MLTSKLGIQMTFIFFQLKRMMEREIINATFFEHNIKGESL